MELNLPLLGRRAVLFGGFLALTFLCVAPTVLRAADTTSTNATANSDEADKAWREVRKLTQPPSPPESWQEKQPSREEVSKFYGEALKKGINAAKDFYTKYPNHPKAEESRKTEYRLLTIAVNQFGAKELEPQLEALIAKRMADPNLSEEERFQMRVAAIQRMLDGLPGNFAEVEKQTRALHKDFPKREEVYNVDVQILSIVEGDNARTLAKEILDSDAPEKFKAQAKAVLKTQENLGKPLDIAFTAVDGREVDLAKMHGKVVLVDFWATWCGPCMGEVPHVKEAYEKLHDKGFEIVGISFDSDKEKLQSTLKEKGMTWAQYFDGEGWKNKYGQQYGIHGIPTMWLVDKKGNLRDMNARGALEEKVTKLLGE